MRLVVVGVGHVGLVTAAALARWGHEVVGVDEDHHRVEQLRAGLVPFHEPGLPQLVDEGVEAGRLSFTDSWETVVEGAQAVFICVGTPSLPGGGADLSIVERVGSQVALSASDDLVLIEKSTVPAQTGERLTVTVGRELERRGVTHRISVASNPEFLREGVAVQDTLRPDRVVYGTRHDWALEVLRGIYAPLVAEVDPPVIETDVATAELIKHASNAFLATRLSFINAVARISELVGADVEVVAEGMGYDHRIGHAFLQPGLGYGGSCFPKDVDGFIQLARDVGYEFGLLEEVRRINEGQRDLVLDKLRAELWHLTGKRITLLGAAFKPHTDDLREAPALHLADLLMAEGAEVAIYDPVALPAVRRARSSLETVEDPYLACDGAHAAVVCTEWPEIASLDLERLRAHLAYPVLVDGRNVFSPADAARAGLHHHSIGRPPV